MVLKIETEIREKGTTEETNDTHSYYTLLGFAFNFLSFAHWNCIIIHRASDNHRLHVNSRMCAMRVELEAG